MDIEEKRAYYREWWKKHKKAENRIRRMKYRYDTEFRENERERNKKYNRAKREKKLNTEDMFDGE